MRLAKSVGSVVGVLVLAGVVLLLTRGTPRPQPKQKAAPRPVAAASAGVQDAFAFAKDVEGRLRGEARYARVYLVPSAANATHQQGMVVVMGEVATDDDLRGLHTAVIHNGVPVALEWQVTVAQPADGGR